MEETATKLSAEAREGYGDKFALWGPVAVDLDHGMCYWRNRTIYIYKQCSLCSSFHVSID